MFKLNLSKLKKTYLLSCIPFLSICYINSYAETVEKSTIVDSPELIKESLTINSPENVHSGDEFEVTILKKVENCENINSITINMDLPEDLYFKKSNLLSSNFDVKVDKSKKKVTFALNKNKILSLSPGDNELIRLKLNVKKNAPKDKNESILFELNNSREKQNISKTILINPKAEISDMLIDGKEFEFDKNKKDYEITVPEEKEMVDISIIRTEGNEKISDKTVSKKLNKSAPKTFKIEDYNLKFLKEKQENKDESSKKKNK